MTNNPATHTLVAKAIRLSFDDGDHLSVITNLTGLELGLSHPYAIEIRDGEAQLIQNAFLTREELIAVRNSITAVLESPLP
jgi:hypothetical protein